VELEEFAGTVMVQGGVSAKLFELVRVTDRSAVAERAAVIATVLPLATGLGLTVRLLTTGATCPTYMK